MAQLQIESALPSEASSVPRMVHFSFGVLLFESEVPSISSHSSLIPT